MVKEVFSVLLNLVGRYFIENFFIYFHQRNWSIILLLKYVVLSGDFGMSVILAS
jgi:hypothetical protein